MVVLVVLVRVVWVGLVLRQLIECRFGLRGEMEEVVVGLDVGCSLGALD